MEQIVSPLLVNQLELTPFPRNIIGSISPSSPRFDEQQQQWEAIFRFYFVVTDYWCKGWGTKFREYFMMFVLAIRYSKYSN